MKRRALGEAETVGGYLKLNAQEAPDRVALIGLDNDGKEIKKYTYKEYYERAQNVAASLMAKKVKPDDRIALVFLPGTVDATIAFFGCLFTGAIPVCVFPPDPRALSRDVPKLAKVLQDCNAVFVLTNAEYYRYAFRPFTGVKWPPVPWLKLNDLKKKKSTVADKDRDKDKDNKEKEKEKKSPQGSFAFLQYTSGSTADPKGVIVSHSACLTNIFGMYNYYNATYNYPIKDFVVFDWVPHFHDMGLICNVLGAAVTGGTLVLLSPLAFLKSPSLWMQLVSRYKTTYVTIPNFALILATKKTTAKDKIGLNFEHTIFIVGAEPVRKTTLHNFVDAFKDNGVKFHNLIPSYGLAEHVLMVTTGFYKKPLRIDRFEFARNKIVILPDNVSDDRAKFCVSCGAAAGDFEVITVDPDTLIPTKPLEIGEVWATSTSKASGYWMQEQLTQEVFCAATADGGMGCTGDGYLRTGDYGFFHEGELYLCGRRKDLVIVAGRNFYPQDIEEVAEAANRHIRAGCVIAFELEVDDQEAIVILAEVREPKKLKEQDLQEIAEDIHKKVTSDFQINCYAVLVLPPHGVPKTTSGKVSRQPAKKKFLENTLKHLYMKKYHISELENVEAFAAPSDEMLDGAGSDENAKLEVKPTEEINKRISLPPVKPAPEPAPAVPEPALVVEPIKEEPKEAPKVEKAPEKQPDAPKPVDKEWLTIFCEVIGADITQITPETELQSLGIASLLVMQLISRLQDELDIEIGFADLIDKKTIAELDAWIRTQAANPTRKRTRITPAKRMRPPPAIMRILHEGSTCRMVPASYSQERIWVEDQRRPELAMYNMWAGLKIQGDFDPVQFRFGLSALVERHEALRTTFHLHQGHLMQVIHKSLPLLFELSDMSVHDGDNMHDILLGFAKKNTARKFDLTKGPLWATLAVALPNNEFLIHISMHHIIGDAWSFNVVFKEAMQIYAGEQLVPPTIQYADYSAWQKEQVNSPQFEAKLEYWAHLLEGELPTIEFPIPRTKPASPPMRPCHFVKVPISDEIVDQIERTCISLNCTRFSLFLALYQVLLHRHSSLDDIIIGTPASNRTNFQVESMVGVFINTLPIRSRINAQTTLRDIILAAQQSAADTNDHQDVPLQKVMSSSRRSDKDTGGGFQALFVHHDIGFFRSRSKTNIPGLKTKLLAMEDGWEMLQPAAMFDLQVLVQEDRGMVSLRFEYNADALEKDTISRMAQHYLILLNRATTEAGLDDNVWRLDLLSPAERHKLLVEWNTTMTDLPSAGKCCYQLISDQAVKTPNNIALVYPEEGGGRLPPGDSSDAVKLIYRQTAGKMTYGELEQLSNFLAQHLMSMGVGPDDLVGLSVEQSSWVMVVGMIAIWKAGGAYVALNPRLPPDRLKYMIDKANSRVVLTLTHLLPTITAAIDARVRVVDVDGQWKKIQSSHRPVRPRTTVAQHNLAYVLFTSGSTGLPKGVMIEHKALVNRIVVYANDHLTAADRVAQVSAYSFDASVPEFFSTLVVGAALYLVPVGVISGPELANFYNKNQITNGGVLTPSRMATLKGERFPTVKRMVAIGEQLTTNIVKMLTTSSRIYNTYGPTEITVSSSEIECFADDPLVTIGKNLPNYLSYVLDRHMQPVPIGVSGELYIGGAGLARGYIGDPSQTQSKFVPNPFLSLLSATEAQRGVLGNRMYKTGDLVRYLPNGELEYIGRTDFQVKLRGLRIELGEIETVISQCEGVRQVVVMVVDGAQENKILVAYVVPEVDEAAVRDYISTKLPAYMIPQVFIMMKEFPMNTSGKVERKLLPVPQNQAGARLEPRNNKERILLDVWSKVLNVKPEMIGADDMFFSLGGDSITAVTLVYHAKLQGIVLTTQQVLQNQTIRSQAEVCELTTPSSAIEGQIPWGTSSMSPAQQWMFAGPLAVKPASKSSFNQFALLQFQQVVDPALVSRALGHVLVHHPALRAVFDGSAMIINEPTKDEVERLTQKGVHSDNSPVCDVHVLKTSEPLSEDFADLWEAHLNPSKGVCVRGILVVSEFAPESYPKLVLTVHSLCVDKLSWNVILDDLQTAFIQLQAIVKVELTRVTSPFRLWTDNLHSMAEEDAEWAERQTSFWRRALSLPSKPLPTTLLDAPANAPAAPEEVTVRLSSVKTDLLLNDDIHYPYNTNIQDILLTALLLAFSRWTDTALLRVDLFTEGRDRLFEDVDLARTVGCFTSKYPVIFQLIQNMSSSERFLRDALLSVKEAVHSVPNQGLGYGMLRYLSKAADSLLPETTQDADVSFRYAGKPEPSNNSSLFSVLQGANGETQVVGKALTSLIELNAQFGRDDGRLQVSFAFRKNKFQKSTITRLSTWYIEELELLLNHLDQNKLSRYPTPSDYPVARLTQSELAAVFTPARPVESVMDIYVASQLQQGMLFHTLGDKRTGNYTNQLVFDIKGPLMTDNLSRSFVAAVQHFPALRTEYAWEGLTEPHSIIRKSAEPQFDQLDWRNVPNAELPAKVIKFLEDDRVRGFDLTKAPLMRVTLIRLGEQVHRAVVTSHHITTDGWSHTTILSKIFTLYQRSSNGEFPFLQASQVNTEDGYKQFIEWTFTRNRSKAQEYWRRILKGVAEPTPIPIIGKSKVEGAILPGKVDVVLSADLTQKLKTFADKNGFTLSMILNAAWGMLLHKYSGNNDVVFGSAVSIRPPHIDVNAVGLFMNTVPVRLVIDEDKPAAEVVRAFCKQQIERSEHEHLSVAAIQACSDVPKGVNLMDSIFIVENYPIDETIGSENGMKLEMVDTFQKTNFVLSVFAFFTETQVKLYLMVDRAFVQTADATRMINHYIQLLTSFSQNPTQATKSLPILTQQEKTNILVDWNTTYKAYPGAGKCAHQVVSEQALRTPQATALVYPKEVGEAFNQSAGKLTYQELEEMSNTLAQKLVSLGVKPDDLVGLSVEQSSWVMVVGMIAIWKAGGAYVALNPRLPADRLKYMIDKTNSKVVLTLTHLLRAITSAIDPKVKVVDVDGQWEKIQSAHRPLCPTTAVAQNNLAYVLFTSGSTGLPKGVMIEHKALCNRLVQYAEDHLTAEDRVAQASAYSFDASLPELFSTLVAGASLYLLPMGVIAGPELAAFYRDNNITNGGILTPSRMATLKNEKFPSVKRVVAIGEQLTTNIVKMMAEGSRIFNTYGPTEITVSSSEIECFANDPLVTIGKNLPNYLSYVLDKHMQPVPIGVSGELYIGGVGLARGYINDQQQTSSKFIPNPFFQLLPFNDQQRALFGNRMYKTGDVVRYLPNGEMEYIGRTDFQVKLRGLRIELGEIETVISQAEGVRQVVVMVVDGAHDNKILVAYVVPGVDETSLRTHIGSKLPQYMVPQVFVMMHEFPMNTSGKVERKLLPAPQIKESVQLEPRNEKERILLEVWSKVLNIKPELVGVDDTFFALGGDSITAVTLVYHAKLRGVILTTQQVLSYQTIPAQAEVCELLDTGNAIEKQVSWGTVTLAPTQQWVVHGPLAGKLAGESSSGPKNISCNQYAFLQFKQPVEEVLVARAIGHLIVKHPVLRATFDASHDAMTFKEPTSTDMEALTVRGVHPDLSPLVEGQVLQSLETLTEDFAESWDARLNPTQGINIRGLLVMPEVATDANPKLLIAIHHLCVDKYSWGIIFADLQAALAQILANSKQVEFAKSTSPLRVWNESLLNKAETDFEWNDTQAKYWCNTLSLPHFPILPILMAAPANTPNEIGKISIRLSNSRTALLHDDAIHSPFRTTVSDVLLTAFLMAYARWTGGPAILIDLFAEGRESLFKNVDVTRTVGCCMSRYPAVLTLSAKDDSEFYLRDALLGVKEALHKVPNQGIGYGMLRYMTKLGDSFKEIKEDPEVCFRYTGKAPAAPEGGMFSLAQGGNGMPQDLGKALSHFLELDVSIDEAGKLQLIFAFRKSRFQKSAIARLSAWFIKDLELVLDFLVHNKASRHATPSDYSLARISQGELNYVFTPARTIDSVMDVYVTSQLQQGMLYHALADKVNGSYTNQLVFDIKGPLVLSNLQRAFIATVHHFPALRTEYAWDGLSEPHAVIRSTAEPDFDTLDWRGTLKSVVAAKLRKFLEADRARGFDLTRAPLMRITVIRLEEKVYRVVITDHHIITDGWSHTTILAKIFQFYQLSANGEVPRNFRHGFAHTTDGFKQYVEWTHTRNRVKAQEYWRSVLTGFSEPTAIPIIGKSKTEGAVLPGKVEASISAELTQKLKTFGDKNGFTLSMIMNAGWALLLHRYSGNNDIVFGSTVSIRPPHIDVDSVGLFMNTVPIRLIIDEDKPATEVVRALYKQQLERSEHEHLSVAAIQACSDVPKGVSLMDSISVVENYPIDQSLTSKNSNLSLEFVDSVQKTNFILSNFVFFGDTQINLLLLYDSAFVQAVDASRMMNHYIELLNSFAQNPNQPTKALPILTQKEKNVILYDWNQTYKVYPTNGKCVHELVSEQAQRTPTATALVYPLEEGDRFNQAAGEMTYAELEEMSNCLAQHLVSLGVKPDDLVGLCVEQSSWVLIVGMLGIWKAGGAYVALSPKMPSDRLHYMMERASAKVVLTMTHLLGLVAAAQEPPAGPSSPSSAPPVANKPALKEQRVVDVDGKWDEIVRKHTADKPNTGVKPANLAYVLFTSGSTGLPKGVMIEHKALTNMATIYVEKYLSPEDRVSQVSAFTFDPSLTEIFSTLMVGASLYLVPSKVVAGPDLANFWRENRITNTGSPTPSRLATLKNEELPDVKTILTIGEAVTLNLVKALTHGKKFINLYGPTEATVACTEIECRGGDSIVTIGRPLPNYLAYVLDRNMQPVPCGVAGELYIGGAGLARGYIGDPVQTKARFIPNPFASVLRHTPEQKAIFGDKIYKTGDVVRWLHDGTLEYIGRADFQVKLRGLRIELGEIETVIAQCEGVRQAVVLVVDGAADSKILVAYVVPGNCNEPAMRAHLASKLPAYMLPQVFVFMDEFPRNPSGKVERKLLPAPNLVAMSGIIPPSTNDERTLLAIWSQTMGLDPALLGVNTNFFEVGGDSLLVIKVISTLRQSYNVTVGVADFLQHPTIADFALAIPSMGPVSPNGEIPHSPSMRQQRIASLLPRRKTTYNKARTPSVVTREAGRDRSISVASPTDTTRARIPSFVEEGMVRAPSHERDRTASFVHPDDPYSLARARSPSVLERTRAAHTDAAGRLTPRGGDMDSPRVRSPSYVERGHDEGRPIPSRARALSSVEADSPRTPRERDPPKSPRHQAASPPEQPKSPKFFHRSPKLNINTNLAGPSVPKLVLDDIFLEPPSPKDQFPPKPASAGHGQHLSPPTALGILQASNSAPSMYPPPPSPDHTARAAVFAPSPSPPGTPVGDAVELLKNPGPAPATPLQKKSSRRKIGKSSRTVSLSTLETPYTIGQIYTTPLSFIFLRQFIAIIILAFPILASFVGAYISTRLLSQHFDIDLYYMVPLVYPIGGIISTLGFIPYKWIWIGRYKHCIMRLWSWKFMVWWALDRYRSFISSMFLVYAVGTPFLNMYYTMCGMYIGSNVFINTTRISEFDLVILEDEACIDEGATLCGHEFEEGAMKLGDVLVRQYSTVGAWSIVNPYAEIDEGTEVGPFSLVSFGMYIPPETKWQGSPAQQVSARPFDEHDVGPLFTYSSYVWTLPFVFLTWVATTALFYGAAWGNIRLLIFIADKYGFLTAGGFLPLGLMGMGLSQTFVGLLFKRLMIGRAFPGTYKIYGSYYLRRWAVQQVSNMSLLVTLLVSSTSFAGWYYSLWGAQVGSDTEIMMIPSLCDSDLVSIGRSSFLGSETRFLCSQVKDGAMHCEMIHVGSYTFVGNNSCIVGNAFVSDDVVVGSMTLLDSEVYPAGSTLVGTPCISLGLRPPPMDAPDHVGKFGRVALDLFIILSFTIVLSVALAPPLVFLHWVNDHVHPLVLAALFPPVFAWFFFAVFLLAVLLKWLLVGRLDTQPHHAASFQRQLSFFVKVLLAVLGFVANLFYGTGVIPFCLRMLGAKIGSRTCINTLYVDDWDLITIANDVYVGENTVIQCHTAEGMVFKCLPVAIGRNCVIGKSTVVLPGARLKTGTTLGDLSLVMKNEVLENVGGGLRITKEEMGVAYKWEGSPAKLQPKNGVPDAA